LEPFLSVHSNTTETDTVGSISAHFKCTDKC
jgi:hypothetical protein